MRGLVEKPSVQISTEEGPERGGESRGGVGMGVTIAPCMAAGRWTIDPRGERGVNYIAVDAENVFLLRSLLVNLGTLMSDKRRSSFIHHAPRHCRSARKRDDQSSNQNLSTSRLDHFNQIVGRCGR